MDISNTNPVSGTSYIPPFPQSARQPQADSTAGGSADGSSTDIQAQYEAAIHQAAASFKDSYPLSDQTFTIYKDVTGQYITRYVSLLDGTITYVPEPVLVRQASSGGSPSVSIDV